MSVFLFTPVFSLFFFFSSPVRCSASCECSKTHDKPTHTTTQLLQSPSPASCFMMFCCCEIVFSVSTFFVLCYIAHRISVVFLAVGRVGRSPFPAGIQRCLVSPKKPNLFPFKRSSAEHLKGSCTAYSMAASSTCPLLPPVHTYTTPPPSHP